MASAISDQIKEVLEATADKLIEIGMGSRAATYRAMILQGLENLPTELCAQHLKDDLERFRFFIDHLLAELETKH